MLTRVAGTLSKALRAPGSGGREALRWSCAVAIAGGLLLGLEGMARRHGGAPPAPVGMALEVVTLPALAARTLAARTRAALRATPARASAPAPAPKMPRPEARPARSAPAVPTPALTGAEPPPPRFEHPSATAHGPESLPRPQDGPPATPVPNVSAPAEAVAATPPAPATTTSPAAQSAAGPAAQSAAPARLVPVQALDPGFRLVQPVQPRYPRAARRLRRAGSVEVELEVAPDGRVTTLAVQEDGSGWGFAAAARDAFAGARFTPPRVRGEPVRVRWRKTLLFRP